jgi:hypothetical protein
MACGVQRRRVASASGKEAFWSSVEAEYIAESVYISKGCRQEFATVEIRICPVDTGDDSRADQEEVWVSMSAVPVGRLLPRLGMSCYRPLARAYQQDTDTVNWWMRDVFPKIAAQAKEEGASIFFADEAGIRSDYHAGTTWLRAGRLRRYLRQCAFRIKQDFRNNVQGRNGFWVTDNINSSDIFCNFIDRLLHHWRNQVYLIVDGHLVYRNATVRKHVESYNGRLRLIRFPLYSMETNPDELNGIAVKQKVGRSFIAGPDKLKGKVIGALRWLQKSPEIIRSFFNYPDVSYALC